MLLPLALGGMIGGTGLTMLGEYQGANAMEKESQRRLDEENQLNAERRGLFQSELSRREASPVYTQEAAATGANFRSGMRALAPAATSGAAALGLSGADAATTQAALLPSLRVSSRQGAEDERIASDNTAMRVLSGEQQDVENKRRMSEALAQQRMAVAAQKGAIWRNLGSTMQNLGQMGMLAGMSAPMGGAAAGAPGASTYGGGSMPGPAPAAGPGNSSIFSWTNR